MVTLVRTLITGAAVTGGGVCSLYFEDPATESDLQQYIDSLDTFWTSIAANSDEDVTFEIEGIQPRYAASNGALQEVFSLSGEGPHVGTQSGNNVPRASQALIRWRTSDVVNGRLLQGRTFLPGVPTSAVTDTGLLDSTHRQALEDAAEQLLSDVVNRLVVWHRPQNGAGGETQLVTSASVWDRFAVLRSRRD